MRRGDILTFDYGKLFGEVDIEKLNIDVILNGELVKTFTIDNSNKAKVPKYKVDTAGEFIIKVTYLLPFNNYSNKFNN